MEEKTKFTKFIPDGFEYKKLVKRQFYLSAIIPVIKDHKWLDNFVWNGCLTPVGDDLTVIEKTVWDCAAAGADTIWIVCDEAVDPLIRMRMGEWVLDPVAFKRFDKCKENRQRRIPIYYVPVSLKDRKKRDCLAWSVIYGAIISHNVSRQLSKWLRPDMYLVSFPYYVIDEEFMRSESVRFRLNRATEKKHHRVFFSHSGKTIRDGKLIPFTMNLWDVLKFKDILERRQAGSNFYTYAECITIPDKERWPERFFTMEDVFGCLSTINSTEIELEYFHDITTWKDYCAYLETNYARNLSRPPFLQKSLKRKRFPQWELIGVDDDFDKKE